MHDTVEMISPMGERDYIDVRVKCSGQWEFSSEGDQDSACEKRKGLLLHSECCVRTCHLSTVESGGKGFCLLTTSFWCWCEM
jgi:hypothetical protein